MPVHRNHGMPRTQRQARDIIERIESVGADRRKDLATNYTEMCHVMEAAASEIRRLRDAARTAADIIDTNLYHQREKVADASSILRQALDPL